MTEKKPAADIEVYVQIAKQHLDESIRERRQTEQQIQELIKANNNSAKILWGNYEL